MKQVDDKKRKEIAEQLWLQYLTEKNKYELSNEDVYGNCDPEFPSFIVWLREVYK